jgi:hypothetical protein
MLDLDSAQDAVSAEDVFAGGNDWVVRVVIADGAFFLAFDVQTESFLEKTAVLGIEGNDLVLIKEFEDITDTLSTESPVIAAMKFQ